MKLNKPEWKRGLLVALVWLHLVQCSPYIPLAWDRFSQCISSKTMNLSGSEQDHIADPGMILFQSDKFIVLKEVD